MAQAQKGPGACSGQQCLLMKRPTLTPSTWHPNQQRRFQLKLVSVKGRSPAPQTRNWFSQNVWPIRALCLLKQVIKAWAGFCMHLLWLPKARPRLQESLWRFLLGFLSPPGGGTLGHRGPALASAISTNRD